MRLLLLASLLLLSIVVQRAESGGDFLVEVLVVVDSKAIQFWETSTGKTSHDDLKEDIRSMFVEVNRLYSSLLRWNLKVRLAIKDIIVDVNILQALDGNLDLEGLSQFEAWLYQKGLKYDVALLYTGEEIVTGESKGTLGFARIGDVCKSSAVAVTEFHDIDFGDILVTAHEIGHVLGSEHDGKKHTPGEKCDAADGNTMTGFLNFRSPNHFKFSRCSYTMIYRKLAGLDKELQCLKDGDEKDIPTGKPFGQRVTADELCRRGISHEHVDNTMYVDRSRYQTYGDNICTFLECSKGGVMAVNGMTCGKNKICSNSKCVESPDGDPNVSDYCPLGDQPFINYKHYTKCSQLPQSECGVMKTICCETCKPEIYSAADIACRRLTGKPDSALARNWYPRGTHGHKICEYLACTTGMKDGFYFKMTTFYTPSGLYCGKNKVCQGFKCVKSEKGSDLIPDYCPYGDMPWIPGGFQMTCRRASDRYECSSYDFYNVCCDSCKYK